MRVLPAPSMPPDCAHFHNQEIVSAIQVTTLRERACTPLWPYSGVVLLCHR